VSEHWRIPISFQKAKANEWQPHLRTDSNQLNDSVKELIKFHNYETEKITRKSVTWQNISSCLVLPPKIVMHDSTYIGRRSVNNIKCIVHDDLGWKNRTTLYNCRFSAASLAFQAIFVHQKMSTDICVVHDDLEWKNRTTRCNRFWRAGCSRLEYADIRLVY